MYRLTLLWIGIAVAAYLLGRYHERRAARSAGISNREIRDLLARTDANCVRVDCRVALGLEPPRGVDTRERVRQRCAEEFAMLRRSAS